MKKKAEKVDNKEEEVAKFLKRQWLTSKKFMDQLDYIQCSLKDDVFYSEEEVNKAIEAFKGGN